MSATAFQRARRNAAKALAEKAKAQKPAPKKRGRPPKAESQD